jgi:hypothetical protein
MRLMRETMTAIISLIWHSNVLDFVNITYAFWVPLPSLHCLSLFYSLNAPGKEEKRIQSASVVRNQSLSLGISSMLQQSRSGVSIPAMARHKSEPREFRGIAVSVEYHVMDEQGEDECLSKKGSRRSRQDDSLAGGE